MTARTAVVICEPLRTPVGRLGGALAPLSAAELATVALEELVRRTGLGEGDVDDVILGQCYPNGEAPAIGRVAALDAGLGIEVPGLQIDRRCGSGLQAVLYAAMQVADRGRRPRPRRRRGVDDRTSSTTRSACARGVKRARRRSCMDRLDRARETAGGTHHPVPGGMIETAENLRRDYGISPRGAGRARRCAPTSAPSPLSRPASSPTRSSPVDRARQRGKPEHRRRPRRAPPRRHHARAPRRAAPDPRRSDPEATVTAGNASGQNDGAAVCVVTHPRQADELGLTPLLALARGRSPACAPGGDGHRPGPGHRRRPRPRRPHARRHRPHRAQRGLRRPGARRACASGGSTRRDSSGSTSTAPASRSATRSAPPAPASWPRCCASCAAATAATAWRRCASAAARAWPRSSRPSGERGAGRRRHHRPRGRPGRRPLQLPRVHIQDVRRPGRRT